MCHLPCCICNSMILSIVDSFSCLWGHSFLYTNSNVFYGTPILHGVYTNAGLMTSVDHLENLAVLKIYTFQGITTQGKAPYLNYRECISLWMPMCDSGVFPCAVYSTIKYICTTAGFWWMTLVFDILNLFLSIFFVCAMFSLVYLELLCHPLRLTVKVTFLKTQVLRVLLKKKEEIEV